ncbi:MAG: LamG-like jellyroll fold domain-containing protein [Pseudomonadota bacterium]
MDEVTTVAAPDPTVPLSAIQRVPTQGTGLVGQIYDSNFINSISSVDTVLAEGAGDRYTFEATDLFFRSGNNSTLADFLGEDADSLNANAEAIAMDTIAFDFSGYVFIPEGEHEITVRSDDGFRLSLGGQVVSSHNNSRPDEPTTIKADFDGGLYKIDLLYYDGFGNQSLSFEIDGLPVDQSAFYKTPADFTTNAAGGVTVPVARYHPSKFLGEASLGGAETIRGSAQNENLKGNGGDDVVNGFAGNDLLEGGYGDDLLRGGAGDDVLDGGRGSDALIGGEGDDTLISRSDAGEQRIGQLAIGQPTRGDPDNEVNNGRQKLKGYENQEFEADDFLSGGEGNDTFVITALLNAKEDIIRKHVRSDGTINWQGVAGENDELHDHWVDSFGIDTITDYNKEEDNIAIIGHTATVRDIEYRDTDGDGDEESIITVISQQHGGGGAHTQDLLGQVIVHGDRVTEDDIETDAGVFHGIVETWDEVAEALYPTGTPKTSTIGGQTVRGYDTRTANGQDGAIINSPERFIDNKYKNSAAIEWADPTKAPPPDTSRGLDQLGTAPSATGQQIQGTAGNDVLTGIQEEDAAGLPGAISFWRFDQPGNGGTFDNERDGPDATAYELVDNAAVIQSNPNMTDGPTGRPNSALLFDGDDDFAFIKNDQLFQVAQGTIALWVRPDDLSDDAIILSKDAKGQGEGGHFKLGHDDDGRITIRFSEGDAGGNKSWTSSASYFEEGEWAHIAVGFDSEGLTVYVDGVKVPDFGWTRDEGNVDVPGYYKEAYLINNDEPWVIGADTSQTEVNGTAGAFATDNDELDDAFTGAVADFGLWGGFSLGNGGDSDEGVVGTCGANGGPLCFCGSGHGNSLTQEEVLELFLNGPGDALTNPSGTYEIDNFDDQISGGAGFDTVAGGGGDDILYGGAGADSIIGGYGDDSLNGGADADVLIGGRGSDVLVGGSGADVLVSRSDAGEQRIGQLAIGDPSRPDPDGEVNMKRQKLYGWEDQTLVADDILVGGQGRDTFLFNPGINAKRDIIMEHVNDDRTIDWAGVAGENDELHDHWVDSFGIDVIADYNAEEDTIAIIGHTVEPNVRHQMIDSDGDGSLDKVVSIITVYSQQGNNGGAHDEDLIGQIIVHGDLVDEDDLIVDAGVTHGVVATVDQLQEAVAPTGETKVTIIDGERVYGYDTRDENGNKGAIMDNPHLYTENDFAADVQLSTGVPEGLEAPRELLSIAGRNFDGQDDFLEIPHRPAMARDSGTYAFSFTADEVNGNQALISKDASGFETGGHMHIHLDGGGDIKARFQSTSQSVELRANVDIEAGDEHHVAFTFEGDTISLYVDGVLEDSEDDLPESFVEGMKGNTESFVVGASTTSRQSGTSNNLKDHFNGRIEDISLYSRALASVEVFTLAAEGNLTNLNYNPTVAGNGNQPADAETVTTPDEPTPEVEQTVMRGTAQSERILGSEDNEMIVGLEGNDSIFGRGGIDNLIGQEGNDLLVGGSGVDMLRGDVGNDILKGLQGNDNMYGGDGRDRLLGQDGDDMMQGGAGNDRLIGGTGDDVMEGQAGVDILVGQSGNDSLYGGADRDILVGGADDDLLNGGDGNDVMRGQTGNDRFEGGAGIDVMVGGGGADTFVMETNGGVDRVVDFQVGIDSIEITGIGNFRAIERPGGLMLMGDDGARMYLIGINENEFQQGDLIV